MRRRRVHSLPTIDIQYNTNVAKSDWYVPVYPATDGALVFGILSEVIAQGWQDSEFLRAHTEAPFLVKEDNTFLRMSDLGVPATEGPVNAMTGKPTVIDPEVVWDEATRSAKPYSEAEMPALEGIPEEIEGFRIRPVWSMILEAISAWTPERASVDLWRACRRHQAPCTHVRSGGPRTHRHEPRLEPLLQCHLRVRFRFLPYCSSRVT